ncbi:MAG: hypothetical protein PHD13_04090 [Methanocellales archaeon]|nr:hypothetical protein [Methanocellales archaeon]MDD3292097.1 hypothetical protein [Methanocellales archaeon]MDD5235334.1 hypothetical protein [Methanocellales archaeon]MDD5485718.1 hypothetical protein [Methanocellales archaeon]
MSKVAIWALVGIGTLFFLIGSLAGSDSVFILGILMIGAGLYLGLRPGGILRKEQVMDSWGVLIEDGHGRADQVFQDTENFIKESKAPAIEMKRDKIAPGIIRGILGTKRDFLIVTDQGNLKLDPYQTFIGARDYGNNLDVSWYLTYRPSLLDAVLSLIPMVRLIPLSLADLDLFDQQDLNAYVTNCHHSLLKAVEKQMRDLNQDVSKIDRKSKGFLGIS